MGIVIGKDARYLLSIEEAQEYVAAIVCRMMYQKEHFNWKEVASGQRESLAIIPIP